MQEELITGLFREPDERHVVVLTVLIEGCNIPLFLEEKEYADLRKVFDSGTQDIMDAIAEVTNADQRCLSEGDGCMDFACD